LLDYSVKYAELIDLIGNPVQLHVWEGMLHVFVFNTHFLDAARSAMNELGTFLREHISTTYHH
jgi:acetyl esterase/lipase